MEEAEGLSRGKHENLEAGLWRPFTLQKKGGVSSKIPDKEKKCAKGGGGKTFLGLASEGKH